MFNQVKKLESRIKSLEEFLGVMFDDSDSEFPEHKLSVRSYDLSTPKFQGVMGHILNKKKKEQD